MILTEVAIIALARMGEAIALTIKAAIEHPNEELRNRVLKETAPFHELAVTINKRIADGILKVISDK